MDSMISSPARCWLVRRRTLQSSWICFTRSIALKKSSSITVFLPPDPIRTWSSLGVSSNLLKKDATTLDFISSCLLLAWSSEVSFKSPAVLAFAAANLCCMSSQQTFIVDASSCIPWSWSTTFPMHCRKASFRAKLRFSRSLLRFLLAWRVFLSRKPDRTSSASNVSLSLSRLLSSILCSFLERGLCWEETGPAALDSAIFCVAGIWPGNETRSPGHETTSLAPPPSYSLIGRLFSTDCVTNFIARV